MPEIRRQIFRVEELARLMGIDRSLIVEYVKHSWVMPAEDGGDLRLDAEDQSRVCLIYEMKTKLGVNDEAIPLILHLLDHIHYLHRQIRDELKE